MVIAKYLRSHPKVLKVYWPGFDDNAGYAVAKKQMRGFGGMISFTLKDETIETATRVLSSTKIFSLDGKKIGQIKKNAKKTTIEFNGDILDNYQQEIENFFEQLLANSKN